MLIAYKKYEVVYSRFLMLFLFLILTVHKLHKDTKSYQIVTHCYKLNESWKPGVSHLWVENLLNLCPCINGYYCTYYHIMIIPESAVVSLTKHIIASNECGSRIGSHCGFVIEGFHGRGWYIRSVVEVLLEFILGWRSTSCDVSNIRPDWIHCERTKHVLWHNIATVIFLLNRELASQK